MILSEARFETPLGPMRVIACDAGLVVLDFDDRRGNSAEIMRVCARLRNRDGTPAEIVDDDGHPVVALTRERVEAYFAGDLAALAPGSIPLAPGLGSPFQERAWRALLDIPLGQTRSYLQQAAALGSPEAVRAVARANGSNYRSIVIPCHRVIGADGSLTGYGGGLWRKRWLLEHEGAALPLHRAQRQPADDVALG
jgi:AraC family transcriptional regulator, regulatory protein of adaptative response / methylated-DNA-[protein]-cysteine methyltransferase